MELLSSKVLSTGETEFIYLLNSTTLLVKWSNGLSHSQEFRTRELALSYHSLIK